MYGGTKTNLLYKATKLLQWALAITIMVIARVEWMEAVFTLSGSIFIICVVYGYCIILSAQILCLNTLDRAPHQVFIVDVGRDGLAMRCSELCIPSYI